MNRKFEARLGQEGEPTRDSSRRRDVEHVGRAFVEKQLVSHHGKVVDLHAGFAGLDHKSNLALRPMPGRRVFSLGLAKVAVGEASNNEQREQAQCFHEARAVAR
jgi:hypothetical protein